MTQIPSDKLKMIDSESKMETAPRGVSECPHLCPHTSARFKCMHVHKRCTVTPSANPQFMQARKRCHWSECVCTVCMYVRLWVLQDGKGGLITLDS